MNERSGNLFWASQGLIAGIAITVVSVFLIAKFENKISVGTRWDSLFIGVLSVLAALGAVVAIYSQISQTDKHKLQRDRSENLAARAAANTPLSNLCYYQQDCFRALLAIAFPETNTEIVRQDFEYPDLPVRDLSFVIECIKTADPAHSDKLSVLVSKLQIQDARLRSMRTDLSKDVETRVNSVAKQNVNTLILGALEISTFLNDTFPYVRREGEVNSIKPTKSSMFNSAVPLFLADQVRYDEIVAEIERLYQ